MPLIYDPEMTNEDNHILNEEHDLSDVGHLFGCAVFPNELGDDGLATAFFEDDFEVSLSVDDGSTWHPATLFRDYTYGPIHLRASVACSRNVYSNIIVYNHSDKLVRISYRGLGDHADTTYLQEIADAGAFDRDNAALWLAFSGQAKSIDASQIDTDVAGQTPLEVLNSFLGKIVGLMTGAGEISPVLMDLLQEMIGDLETWKNEIINSLPTSGGGGGGETLAEKLVSLSGMPNYSTNLGTQAADSLIGNNETILTALQNIDVAVRAFKTQVINTSFVNGVTEILPYAIGIPLNTTTFFRRAILKDGSRYRYNYETLIPEYLLTGNWEADKLMLIGLDGSANHVTVHTTTTKQEPLQSWIEDREVFEKQVFSNTILAQTHQSLQSHCGPTMLMSCGANVANGQASSYRRWPQTFTPGMNWKGSTYGHSNENPFSVINACQGVSGDIYTYVPPTGSGSAGVSGCIRRYMDVFTGDNQAMRPFTYAKHHTHLATGTYTNWVPWGDTAFGGYAPATNPLAASHDLVNEMYADPMGEGLFYSTSLADANLNSSGDIYSIWHVDHLYGTRRKVYSSAASVAWKPECFTVDRFGNIYVAGHNPTATPANQRSRITKVTITRASSSSWTLAQTNLYTGVLHGNWGQALITAIKVTPSGHVYLAHRGQNTFGGDMTTSPEFGGVFNWITSYVYQGADVFTNSSALSDYAVGSLTKGYVNTDIAQRWFPAASSPGYMSKYNYDGRAGSLLPLSASNWYYHEQTMWGIRRLELDEHENCIFGTFKYMLTSVGAVNAAIPTTIPTGNNGYSSALVSTHYSNETTNGVQIHHEHCPIDQFAIRPLAGGDVIFGRYQPPYPVSSSGTLITQPCTTIGVCSDLQYDICRGSESGPGVVRYVGGETVYFGAMFKVLRSPQMLISGDSNNLNTIRTYIHQRQWNPVRFSTSDGRNFHGCENPKILIPCGPYELGGWGAKI